MSDINDKALCARIVNGDPVAFAELYEIHKSIVFRLCCKVMKNEEFADDITQEVFIQVIRKIHTFRGLSKFTTWLHRTTMNQIHMHYRKGYVRSEQTIDDERMVIILDTKSSMDPTADLNLGSILKELLLN